VWFLFLSSIILQSSSAFIEASKQSYRVMNTARVAAQEEFG
jgi:hypothetical protein